MGIRELVLRVLIFALVLNSVSYLVLRGVFDTGVDIIPIRKSSGPKAIYLIGGCQSRTERPFRFMLDGVPEDTAIYLVEYRNSGFNIEKAATDVLEHIWLEGHNGVTFVAISLGYQLAAACKADGDKLIALNPCIGKVSLLPDIQRATKILPVAYLGLIILGWMSLLPVVKTNGKPYYSLQLLLDQFKVCSNDKNLALYEFSPDVLVMSRDDNVIDNDALIDHLNNSTLIYWVDTIHFGFVDNGMLYREAVVDNL